MNYFKNITHSSFFFRCLILMGIGIAVSCKEENIGQTPVDRTPPSAVTNVSIESLPGGAKISYDLPDETDISYVTCEYIFNDEKKVARSSVYNNYVIIEGLADIVPCDFTLSLVDHSENKSEPYKGSFVPLEPPFRSVFKTITLEPDFGGVVIRWKNESNALIGAFLYAMSDEGEWEEYDLVYSSTTEEKRSIRGYNTDQRKFGVSLIDRFGNTTDTLVVAAEPLYEKLLDKSNFKDGHLAGDNYTSHNSRPISNIWDGNVQVIWHTVPDAGFTPPQTFTIDLGVEAKLSRMMLWNRQDGYVFNQHNLRYFEVWGSKELTHGINDPYWSGEAWKDDWILIGDFEQIKPSGLPLGQTNADDEAATQAGSEFIFESGVGEVRYLRFVVKETWARTPAMHIAEVSIYGDDGVIEE
ncbi:DUF5000 domain-containing lipoprotein [Parapedobacter defluvii]|nr:DUF5000 domain-containing lipoprotein [Parapedobacter defluvii]